MRGAQSSTRDTDTLEICSLSLGVAVEEEKQEQEGAPVEINYGEQRRNS